MALWGFDFPDAWNIEDILLKVFQGNKRREGVVFSLPPTKKRGQSSGQEWKGWWEQATLTLPNGSSVEGAWPQRKYLQGMSRENSIQFPFVLEFSALTEILAA